MNNLSITSKKEENRNQIIDIGKLFCSILVVFLHTVNVGRPYSNNFLEFIASLIHKFVWMVNPVEFFFIASSYFIVSKIEKEKKKLWRYIKRLSILYLFWSAFYVKNYVEYFADISHLSIKTLIVACLKSFRRFFILGSEGHMWYMLSMIYGLLLICPLIYRNRKKHAWSIAVLCYIYALIGDSYYNVVSSISVLKWIIDLTRLLLGNTFLFRGPLFIMIGYYLKTSTDKEASNTMWKWLAFGILVNLELYSIKKLGTGLLYSTTILKPFAAMYFFRMLTSYKKNISLNTDRFAQYSTVIYFLHILVRNIIRIVIKNYYVVWFLSIVVCICVAKFLTVVSKKSKFAWIRMVL